MAFRGTFDYSLDPKTRLTVPPRFRAALSEGVGPSPELSELTGPQAGQTAIDCTFGAGGHARLVAERLGPEGTLIAIDRDPVAHERFAELEAELGPGGPTLRFIGASFAEGLALL